ncbi:hypothetical protein ATCC90586_006279 [Pythium insidiosum]|nr:hypothetical protein ATCC90586_006279 [Pythium insidiosum]
MGKKSDTMAPTAQALAGDSNAVAIMSEVHSLYTRADDGIAALARQVGLTVHPPRRKVNVLIIGNHSAGKSSFINWYIEDNVQRTGVAIETQGFTIVTSGSKKTLAPIKGESTVMLYPYLEPMKQRFGKPLLENLHTCVSTSTKRFFSMVDFIDSPGLVDGDISYPFDVNEAMLCLADSVDLVFVFMDPMGQALCSRTMNVVKLLNQRHFDKLKYYLTKADTVTNPKELMKLMVQITQNIKERINNQHGLEIPAFWLPTANTPVKSSSEMQDDVNQINEVCAVIEKAIHQKVQDNLSQVEKDCNAVLHETNAKLAQFELEIAAKKSREMVAVFFSVAAWTVAIITFLTFVGEFEQHLPAAVVEANVVMAGLEMIYHDGLRPLLIASDEKLGVVGFLKFFGISIALFLVLNGVAKFTHARAHKFATQPLSVIRQWRSHEQTIRAILHRRQELFLEYVRTYTAVEN